MKNKFMASLVLSPGVRFELHIGKSKKVTTSKLLYNGRVIRTIPTEEILVNTVSDGDVIDVSLNANDEIVDEKNVVYFPIGDMIFSKNIILDVKLENGKVNVYFDDILLDTKEVGDFGDLFTRTPRFNTVKRTSYKAIVSGVNEISMVRYANTHQHTEYSRLDGMSKIKDIAKKTEWAGAITDHGVMTGVLKFDNELRALEKKPIIGMEPYIERIDEDIFNDKFTDTTVLDEESLKEYKRNHFKKDHIIMLAKNKTGYNNLIKLASLSWENFYGKNHIKYSDLVEHSEGIIATTACLGSTIGRSLMDDEKKIRETFFDELGRTSNTNKLKAIEVESDIDLLQGDDLDLAPEESALLKEKFDVDITWLSSDEIKELIVDTLHKEDEFPRTLQAFDGYMDVARMYLKKMIAIFGKEDFYVEIQRHKFATEEYYEKKLLQLAEEFGLKIVSGIDSHYLNKEDAKTHEIWLCEATKSNINDPKHLRFPGEGYYLMTSDEALDLFEDLQEALDNSLEIAEKCDLSLKVKEYFLPKFPLPDGYNNDDEKEQVRYFLDLVREGYKKRFYGTKKYQDKTYQNRIIFEEKTILDMGFASYFLIVQDFIAWAKDSNVADHIERYFPKRYYDYDKLPEMAKGKDFEIYVGPGRGSAAGSLVAYCLGITNIDPIDYDLLFERELKCVR